MWLCRNLYVDKPYPLTGLGMNAIDVRMLQWGRSIINEARWYLIPGRLSLDALFHHVPSHQADALPPHSKLDIVDEPVVVFPFHFLFGTTKQDVSGAFEIQLEILMHCFRR